VKNWADGDTVSEADLDDLIGSSNLVFANAAARDAYLVGALAPTPGMQVHMLDDGITYKRITYGGTDYWVPAPNTHLVTMTTASNQVIATTSATQITNLTTVATRNFGNWWASDRFTPTLPGIYQLDAMLTFTSTAGDGYRAVWISLNGATAATAIPGSSNQLTPYIPSGGTSPYALHTRTVCVPLTGTSYVTLMFQHSSTSSPSVGYTGVYGSGSFTAKYLGPP
jgi:hypothetical protein